MNKEQNIENLSDTQFLKLFSKASGMTEDRLIQIIKETILETLPLPPAEIERRKKERQKDTEKRERDNEKRMDQVRRAQADAIRTEEDREEDDEEYPLLAIPEEKGKSKKPDCEPGNKWHDELGRFSDKKSASSWSNQFNKTKRGDCKTGVRKVNPARATKIPCGSHPDAKGVRCKTGKKRTR